jgi:hypothetical protein
MKEKSHMTAKRHIFSGSLLPHKINTSSSPVNSQPTEGAKMDKL